MYPHLLCNVDVMISTLQKCLQDALLSLVGPSSSFRIGSHLGRDSSGYDFWNRWRRIGRIGVTDFGFRFRSFVEVGK